MKFGMNPAPYYRNKRSTTQIMIELLIGLGVVWACAIVYYFLQGGTNGIFAILNPIITTLVCVLTEVLFMLPKHIANKEDFNSLLNKVLNSYGYVTGLILGLLLPVGTSIYVLIITAIFTAAVGKMVFGGFGHNIFNPAIVGRIFAQTAFNSSLKYDTTLSTGATLTTNMANYGWSLDIIGNNPGQTSLLDVLLGNYRGTLGETFTIVILIVGVVLMIRKVIDWRITVTYLVTVFLASVGMGLIGGYGLEAFEYGLVQISLGGVMFGAVFCLTDPVTSPTSPAGKIIFATGCGLFTTLIRFFGAAPEGVAYSILIMNMLTPLIDSTIKGLTTEKQLPNIVTASVITALTITAGCVSGTQVDKLQFVNYLNSGLDNTSALSAQVKHVEKLENGNEVYNVVVAGNLKENYSKKLGNVTALFRSELEKYDKYFKDSKYSNAKYVAEKDELHLSYKENGEKKSLVALKLTTGKGDGKTIAKDIFIVKAGKVSISTGVSTNTYKAIYGVSIDDSLNVIATFPSSHNKGAEDSVAYASVDVDITINFEDQLILSTKLNSFGAGGGYGDAMLDPDNNEFAESHGGFGGFTDEQIAKCLEFYEKYVKVTTPLKFSEVVNVSSGTINTNQSSTDLSIGCTYTTNGYMYALESVVEYAFAYHNYENVGRVGVLDYEQLR